MTFYQYSHGSAAKKQQQVPFNLALGGGGGGGVNPYKGSERGRAASQGMFFGIFALIRVSIYQFLS